MLNLRRAKRGLSAIYCIAGCALPVSSACTLTADTYAPGISFASADAGALVLPDAAPLPSLQAAPECEDEGAEGAIARGTSCSGAIGLLSPPVDAGSSVALAPAQPLTLPPCEGELGEFAEPEPILGVEFEEAVYGPALAADGRTLYFSAYVGGEQQIYSATRDRRGAEFSDVSELPVVNTQAMEGTPFLAASAARLYFFSDRDAGPGNRDIWFSEVGADGELSDPELLPGINTSSSELLPWLSPDERTLLFVSSRPGGRGGADIWRATRPSASAAFGAASNVFELSSDDNEGRVVLSSDGRSAFFTSDRNGGLGGPDIYVATRQNLGTPFGNVRNLNQLNSPATDLDVMLSSDDTELYFASARGGTTELWMSVRRCGTQD